MVNATEEGLAAENPGETGDQVMKTSVLTEVAEYAESTELAEQPSREPLMVETDTESATTSDLSDTEMAAIEVHDAIESLQTSHNSISLADQKRRLSRPGSWVVSVVLALVAMIVPYWYGRDLAINHTDVLLKILSSYDPRGLALVSWMSVVATFAALGLAVAGWHRKISIAVAFLAFAFEQFLGGFSLLKGNFWYSTYVVFHDQAIYANAVNLGIIAAVAGFVAFAVIFVAILIFIKRTSPLNVLTRAGSALSCYLLLELIALFIVLFGGLITIV